MTGWEYFWRGAFPPDIAWVPPPCVDRDIYDAEGNRMPGEWFFYLGPFMWFYVDFTKGESKDASV